MEKAVCFTAVNQTIKFLLCPPVKRIAPQLNFRVADHSEEQCVAGRGRPGGRQMHGSFWGVVLFKRLLASSPKKLGRGLEDFLPSPSPPFTWRSFVTTATFRVLGP